MLVPSWVRPGTGSGWILVFYWRYTVVTLVGHWCDIGVALDLQPNHIGTALMLRLCYTGMAVALESYCTCVALVLSWCCMCTILVLHLH